MAQVLDPGSGGVDPEDFASQAVANGLGAGGLGPSAPPADTGEGGASKPPNMPDWAQWMPWDVADATKNQEVADQWRSQQLGAIADAGRQLALQQGQMALNQAIGQAQQQMAAQPQLPADWATSTAGMTPDLGIQTAGQGDGGNGETARLNERDQPDAIRAARDAGFRANLATAPGQTGTPGATPALASPPDSPGAQAPSWLQTAGSPAATAAGPGLSESAASGPPAGSQMGPTGPSGSPATASSSQSTPGSGALTMGDLADLFHQVLNRVGGAATAVNEAAVANGPAIQAAVQGAPKAVLGAAMNPTDAAINVVNAINAVNGRPAAPTTEQAVQQGVLTPGQAAAAQMMGGLALGGPEGIGGPAAAATDMAKAGVGAAGALAGRIADNVGLVGPSWGDAAAGDVMAGAGVNPKPLVDAVRQGLQAAGVDTGLTAKAASTTFDMDHPLVQKVAEVIGPEDAQKAVDVLNDPTRMQRILRAPSRIANDTDQVAYQIYRGSKDAAVMQAVQQGQGLDQAVVDAAVAHQPDPTLAQQLEQSVKNAQANPAGAGRVPTPKQPLLPEQETLLGQVQNLPNGAADAVVRDAARTVTGLRREPVWANLPEPETATAAVPETQGPAELPSGRRPGPQPLPEAPLREPTWPNPIGPAPEGDPNFEVLGLRNRAFGSGIGSAPPPEGIDYGPLRGGNSGGTPPPGSASPLGPLAQYGRNSIPGLLTGAASGGAVWTQDKDDALWRRALLTALAFKAGSALPYGFFGGPRSEMGGRFLQAYVNNLLGPSVTGMKGLTDVASLATDGGFNAVRAMARGGGSLLHGDAEQALAQVQAARGELLGYYSNLLHGDAWREGVRGAAEALNPLQAAATKAGNVPGVASLSETASTNNLRAINAVMKFMEPIMGRAEQGGMNAALRASAGEAKGLEPAFVGQTARMTTEPGPLALERAHSGMMMGAPEGGVGRALQAVFGAIQRVGGAGRFVEPFANIPANLIDRGVSSIPGLGLLNTIGSEAPDAVVARNVLGTAAYLLQRGLFQTSGSGPTDPQQRKMWLGEGNIPNSVKLPWSDRWMPINKVPLLPLRGALEFDNALTDVKLHGADPTAAGNLAVKFGSAVASEIYLPSLIQMAVALQKGDTSQLPTQVAGLLKGLLPIEGRLLAQAEAGAKPNTSGTAYRPAGANVAQKVGAAVEAQTLANVPHVTGLPEQQPNLTPSGQTTSNAQTGLGVLAPTTLGKPVPDAVTEAFGQAGLTIPNVSPTLSVNGHDVALDGAQMQRFSEVRGQYLAQHVRPGMAAARLQTVLEEARTAAENDFKRANPDVIRAAPKAKQAAAQKQTAKSAAWTAALGGTATTPTTAAPAAPTTTMATKRAAPTKGQESAAWTAALGR